MNLADWFPDEDHRFYMRFELGNLADYFKPTESHDKIVAERRRWFVTNPAAYAALLPEGVPLLDEAITLAQGLQILPAESDGLLAKAKSPWEKCLALGELWEPDFVLLKPEADETFRVVAGCVCFPSSWSLPEKIGHPMEFVHGVVPGLHAVLGKQINSMLGKMKPGIAWQRMNWSLSASPELNQHPERVLPQFASTTPPAEIYLRLEDQTLVKLPETQGVLFGIRILVHPLIEVKKDPDVARGLARALKTMAEPVAAYKKLSACRATAVQFLDRVLPL